MEQEIFTVDPSKNEVKAIGVKVSCNVLDLHVYINGVDITKVSDIENIRVTFEKKE